MKMTLTINELNLCNMTKFNIEVDDDVVVITVPISNGYAVCKLYEQGIPVEGYQILLNSIFFGHFHLTTFMNTLPLTELEFRAHYG